MNGDRQFEHTLALGQALQLTHWLGNRNEVSFMSKGLLKALTIRIFNAAHS